MGCGRSGRVGVFGVKPRLVRKCAAVCGVLMLAGLVLLAAGAASADAATWQVQQLTFDGQNDVAPKLSHEHLIWEAWDGNDFELFLRNLATGLTTPLTSNAADDTQSVIEGDWITWAQYDGDAEIMLYEIPTGTTTMVTNNVVDDTMPDVWDGRVVWQGWTAGGYEIFLRHTNGQVVNISQTVYDDFSPRIDGTWVFWTSRDGPSWDPNVDLEIYGYNIDTATRYRLTNNIYDDDDLVAGGRFAAWRTYDGTDGEIVVFDTDSGTTLLTQLTANSVEDYSPRLTWGRAAWEQRVGGQDGEILIHDLVYGNTIQITSNSADEWFRGIEGALAVWAPHDGTDFEVMVYDSLSGQTWQLTNNTTDDGFLPLVGGFGLEVLDPYVAWAGYDGTDTDIFLATLEVQPDFFDVSSAHPYYNGIDSMRRWRLINGYDLGQGVFEFRPDEHILRAQFAKMVCGAQRYLVGEDLTCPFPDLGPDPLDSLYPHDYIAQAAIRGVTTGTTAGTFEPWAEITRAQVITMIVRSALNEPLASYPAVPADFQGVLGDFHPIHGESMRWAEYFNFMDGIVGFGPGWDPWAPATRGEVAHWLTQVVFR